MVRGRKYLSKPTDAVAAAARQIPLHTEAVSQAASRQACDVTAEQEYLTSQVVVAAPGVSVKSSCHIIPQLPPVK